eukprot:scaffold6015_cov278-Chaetoceros_neogracile.AAC.5
MESVRFILTGLVAGLLLSSVESFAPVKSVAREQLPITAVQAFNLPDFSSFFGGAAAPKTASKGDSKSTKTNVIAGASGYIGKSTVRESVRQGYNTIALVRDLEKIENAQGQAIYGQFYEGAKVVQCDVCDTEALTKTLAEIATENNGIEAIISCLASRSGIKKDAYKIDYQATLNCLDAGRDESVKARHFVLLSAYCCKNPWLQFQQAKLKFEAALQDQNDMTWSAVRPTAFFKSVSGQLEVIQSGAPFVMFGDGKGEMLYKAVGKEPNFFYAPLWLFDVIIDSLQWAADTFNSEKLENAAETGRIGKYYAVEDMLTTDPSEKYGTMTLQEHYNKIAVEGQEYDPYTTMFAKAPVTESKEEKEAISS